MVPAICTFLGAIFSCTNYFRVIFTGGVGKNGSTIAVSLNTEPFPQVTPVCQNVSEGGYCFITDKSG